MEPILDFHVHPFRDSAHCMNFYPEMPPLDAFGMQEQLRSAGIRHICGSVLKHSFPMEDFSSLRALNDEAMALKGLLGDFYTPGFHVHPAYLRESEEEISRMHRLGGKLMGELVPYLHGWGDFSEKNFLALLDAAEQYGMICSYHTPFSYDMEAAIRSHPGIRFVAAHPGDRDRVEEHIRLMKRCENLYLDLSGTGLFRFGMLKHLVAQVGADRILFGTDYPICNPNMYVQAVCFEDISDEAKRKIFYENANHLLAE